MSNKYDKIVSMNIEKKLKRIKCVENTIERMARNNKKISVYSVAKEAKCSRSFIYNNQQLISLINQYREKLSNKMNNPSLINIYKNQIKNQENQLKNLNKKMESDYQKEIDSLKLKNQKLQLEIEKYKEENERLAEKIYELQMYGKIDD